MFIFACTKTNQKVQPVTWFDCVELPCVPQSDREFENSHPLGGTQTGQTPVSVSFTVLGYVRWLNNRK